IYYLLPPEYQITLETQQLFSFHLKLKFNMRRILTGFTSLLLLAACNNQSAESAKSNSDTTATTAATTEPKAAEIADAKYMDYGKRFLTSFAKGDIDGWLNDWQD